MRFPLLVDAHQAPGLNGPPCVPLMPSPYRSSQFPIFSSRCACTSGIRPLGFGATFSRRFPSPPTVSAGRLLIDRLFYIDRCGILKSPCPVNRSELFRVKVLVKLIVFLLRPWVFRRKLLLPVFPTLSLVQSPQYTFHWVTIAQGICFTFVQQARVTSQLSLPQSLRSMAIAYLYSFQFLFCEFVLALALK